MRGGHNRKPAAVKSLAGTARADRTNQEPDPGQPSLYTPRWLMPQAKQWWRKLAPRLGSMGVLGDVDLPALMMLVTHLAIAQEAAQIVATEGVMIADVDHREPDGSPSRRKHPALQVLRDNSNAFKGYAALFGLTPADRARLSVAEQDDEPSLADVLFQSIEVRGE